MGIFKGPLGQNPWARAPPPQRPHLSQTLLSPHSSWVLTLTIGRPWRGASHGAWHHNAGDWGPPSPCARLTLPPGRHPGPSGWLHSFRAGEIAGPSEPMVNFQGPLCQNSWAHASPPQRPHLGLPLRWLHSPQLWPVGLLGANPNSRSAPKVPFPRGLVPQCWGLRTPEHQCQTHPAAKPPPRSIGAPPLIQAGESPGPSKYPATIKGPPRQNTGAKLPLPSALTSTRPSAAQKALALGLLAFWGLTLTLGWPPRGYSQGPWSHNAGD